MIRHVTEEGCCGIICAGFGGQGIMFMGKLLAQAGLEAGLHVTWMPSYGAEVRGGTAYSMVKISKTEIGSPIVTMPDVLIAMNKPSLVKYEVKVKEGGIIIMNKSLIDKMPQRKGVAVINIPMTKIASEIGDARSANMVALGAFVKRAKIFGIKTVENALRDMVQGKEELLVKNKHALERGYALG